jgi:hypothetical protein
LVAIRVVDQEFLVVALEWQPEHPDYITARSRRPWLSVLVRNLDPIVNPAPPTEYAAHVTFPARIQPRVRLRPALQQIEQVEPLRPDSDLHWRGRYPDRFPARRLSIFSINAFQISSVLAVPIVGGWRPRFPDRILRPFLRRLGGMVVDPTQLTGPATCVELDDEALLNPVLSGETLVSPLFGSETCTLPTFASEDLC